MAGSSDDVSLFICRTNWPIGSLELHLGRYLCNNRWALFQLPHVQDKILVRAGFVYAIEKGGGQVKVDKQHRIHDSGTSVMTRHNRITLIELVVDHDLAAHVLGNRWVQLRAIGQTC
jgi:hypothetical protein